MTHTTPTPCPPIHAGRVPCAGCGNPVDSRDPACEACGLIFGCAPAEHRLWVPLRTPADHGPRAYAAQLLEMLIGYRLIADAWLDDETEDGFVVVDGVRRALTAGQVLDEYGSRVVDMVTAVMEHSPLTTTEVGVKVAAPSGPVPFIEDVGDRMVEYPRFWGAPR